jgi:hypothetical protein
MTLALWLEETPLAIWVGESDIGYPLLLSLHVIGLAIFAGLLTVTDLRLFGGLRQLPFAGLIGPMGLAWAGLFVNAVSGIALFTSQASVFVASTPFRIKLAMIVVAAVAAASNQKRLQAEAISWDRAGQASLAARGTAVVSLAAIVSAIVAGLLIAYF